MLSWSDSWLFYVLMNKITPCQFPEKLVLSYNFVTAVCKQSLCLCNYVMSYNEEIAWHIPTFMS